AVVLDRSKDVAAEAVIDLDARAIASWTPLGLKPWVLGDETDAAVAAIVRSDPAWQAAMRQRGITDFENVVIDPWTSGVLAAEPDGTRLVRALSFYRGRDRGNPFGRPVEGVQAFVDLD